MATYLITENIKDMLRLSHGGVVAGGGEVVWVVGGWVQVLSTNVLPYTAHVSYSSI